MHKYSVLVFDLGNVLINFDYKIAVQKFNDIEQGLGEKFLKTHQNNYQIHRAFEKGIITEKEFINLFLEALEYKINAKKFSKIYADIFTLNDDVIALLTLLKKKYKLMLMSNTDPLHKKYGWDKYKFLSMFDQLVLSFEVGAVKPEAKIYKAIEKLSRVPSNEHLYIDDIREYTDQARQLGWSAIQFLNYEQLFEELKLKAVI